MGPNRHSELLRDLETLYSEGLPCRPALGKVMIWDPSCQAPSDVVWLREGRSLFVRSLARENKNLCDAFFRFFLSVFDRGHIQGLFEDPVEVRLGFETSLETDFQNGSFRLGWVSKHFFSRFKTQFV